MASERLIGAGILHRLEEVLTRHQFGRHVLLVCDDNTYLAAAEQIVALKPKKFKFELYSIGRHVEADYDHAAQLAGAGLKHDGMIAIGAGTVNDITKYAAHQLGIPYISVATAASMNGYSSSNASLVRHKLKHSFGATPPVAVMADLDIIASAPRRMARAGVGDTLCRSTVEADCLLSHFLFNTPYPRDYFKRMREHEKILLSQPSHLKEAEHSYYHTLMTALLDAGDEMAMQQSSITASQAEHMIAHTLETIYGSEIRALHGELIAVTTISMGELQNKMLLGTPFVRSMPKAETTFIRIFGKQLGPDMAIRYRKKVLDPELADEVNQRLENEWRDMKRELASITNAHSSILRSYMHANIPYHHDDIGISIDRYNAALSYAYLTRDRFTFLDLAQMMGRRVTIDEDD